MPHSPTVSCSGKRAIERYFGLIEKSQAIDPSVSFLAGVISHPAPFRTSVMPRSQQHEALIRSAEQIHPWQESDAEILERVTY